MVLTLIPYIFPIRPHLAKKFNIKNKCLIENSNRPINLIKKQKNYAIYI